MLPDVRIEHETDCIQGGRSSDRATMPGPHFFGRVTSKEMFNWYASVKIISALNKMHVNLSDFFFFGICDAFNHYEIINYKDLKKWNIKTNNMAKMVEKNTTRR